jgi:site-specific DNA-methyltransferase (adenine-specific)
MELMRAAPDGSYDLLIADVQYGIGEAKKQGKGVRNDFILDKRNGKSTPVRTYHTPKDWDNKQPPQVYFDEAFRVSKRRIIFGENYLLFEQKNQSTGRIFWDKVNGNNDFSDGELMWTDCHSSVRQIEFMWNGMMKGKSLAEGRVMNGRTEGSARIHPTEKPVLLYKWLLQNYAKPGDRILDTHGGSMSIAIACYDLGFDLTATELDADYYRDGKARFERHKAQGQLFHVPAPIPEQTTIFQ